jgi:hypothetical protein
MGNVVQIQVREKCSHCNGSGLLEAESNNHRIKWAQCHFCTDGYEYRWVDIQKEKDYNKV